MTRWKAIAQSTLYYQIARKFPNYFRKVLRTMAEHRLPEGYDVDRHFSPSYKPWDQRVCAAPNGDLFKAIRKGTADVVTDTIERFTENGILLSSGEELDADIIITATGLNVRLFGGADIQRNGQTVALTDLMAFKGMMLTGLPNMAFTIGYTNQSWTLKADLASEFACRVITYMDTNGYDTVEPHTLAKRRGTAADGIHARLHPSRTRPHAEGGARSPWRLKQNYLFDVRLIRNGKVDDEALHFTKHHARVRASV